MKKEITTNQFTGGLSLDLNPLITPNNVLTDCLNGTLITFNGNENMLQNDMGNARVETAMLPEGYIPLGTCSHGGFIYVVSYNPEKDLAQIGSFPSPERNIDTTEMDSQGVQSFTQENIIAEGDDFEFVFSDGTKEIYKPLKPLLRKIFDSVELNPGDKFIVFANNLHGTYLSDFGSTTNQIDSHPRLWKIRLASVQDNKTTELENLKWYDTGIEEENIGPDLSLPSLEGIINEEDDPGSDYVNNDRKGTQQTTGTNYYIKQLSDDLSTRGDKAVDIDNYRSLVNGAYSVFSSKKSGKLALLISPEYPDGFSATWNAYFTPDQDLDTPSSVDDNGNNNIEYQSFDIFINSSWDNGGRDVNPEGVIVKFKKVNKNNTTLVVDPFISQTGDMYIKKIPFNLSRKQSSDTLSYPVINEDGSIKKDDDGNIIYQAYDSFNNRIKQEVWVDILDTDKNTENISFVNNRYIHRIYNNSYPDLDQRTGQSKYYISVDDNDFIHPENEQEHDDYKEEELPNNSQSLYKETIYDDYLNNYFNTDVPYKLGTFTIPNDLVPGVSDDWKLEVEVYPYTEAGYFPHLKKTLTIDFSRIGKKSVELTSWKYWISNETEMINWSLDAYTLPEETISKVWLEFYDNQGLCATQILDNLSSYNGEYTTTINLGSNSTYHGISTKRAEILDNESSLIYHKGILLDIDSLQLKLNNRKIIGFDSDDSSQDAKTNLEILNKFFNTSYKKVSDFKNTFINFYTNVSDLEPKGYYTNDAGIIYPNILYGIKLKYNTRALETFSSAENSSEHIASRWLWTCPVFNERYDSVNDFDELNPELQLDVDVKYGSNNNYKPYINSILGTGPDINDNEVTDYSDYVSNTQTLIGEHTVGQGNIESYAVIGLQNNYNTFRFYKDQIDNFNLECAIGQQKAKKNIPQPQVIQEEIAGDPNLLETEEIVITSDSDLETNKNKNQYQLTLLGDLNEKNYTYYSQAEEDFKQENLFSVSQNFSDGSFVKNTFIFNAVHNSKYYKTATQKRECNFPIFTTPITKIQDLRHYNLAIGTFNNKKFIYFTKCIYLVKIDRSSQAPRYYLQIGTVSYKEENGKITFKVSGPTDQESISSSEYTDFNDVLQNSNDVVSKICSENILFLPVIFGNDNSSTQGKSRGIISKDNNGLTLIKDGTLIRNTNLNSNQTGGFLAAISDKYVAFDFGHPITSIFETNMLATTISANIYNNPLPYNGSIFTFWPKLILALLTQIYYKTDRQSSGQKYIFDNYTYYESHQSLYISDIIYKISKNKEVVDNNLIIMGNNNTGEYGFQLSDYIDKIEGKMKKNDDTKELPNRKSVTFIIKELEKNCPIQFQFNYIQPELIKFDSQSKALIESIDKTSNNTLIDVEYDDTLFTYSNSKLSPLNSSFSFKPVQNIDNENGVEYISKISTSTYNSGDDLILLNYTINNNRINSYTMSSLYEFTIPELSNNYLKIQDNKLIIDPSFFYALQYSTDCKLCTQVADHGGYVGFNNIPYVQIFSFDAGKISEDASEQDKKAYEDKLYIQNWSVPDLIPKTNG